MGELFTMYRTNFTLLNDFKYDINFFEDMIPFERDIYIAMLINKIDKEAKSGG